MKTSHPQTNFSKFICEVFGHKYKLTKNVTAHVKEYTCKCCNHQLTTDSNGKLIELTPKYKDINSSLERIYHKRILRSKQKQLTSSIY